MPKEVMAHSKLNNSAIGSWAGYIYQGLCAIYVVLNMIRDDKNGEYKDYTFYLDSFEDFSIHDATGKAISLHQCKDKKNGGNYKEALKQMIEQKDELISQGVCDANVSMYFHCNTKPMDLGEDIVMYKYHDGTETCQSADLMNKITNLVIITLQGMGIMKSAERTCNALFRLVEEQVLAIHERSIESKQKLYEIARLPKCAIKFSTLYNILTSSITTDYNDKEFASLVKFHLLLSLNHNIEVRNEADAWNDMDKVQVSLLEEKIAHMDAKDFIEFLKRIEPANEIKKEIETLTDTANKSKAEKLIEIVGRAMFQLSDICDWNENNQKETPAVFDIDDKTIIIQELYKNSANSDCLRDYNWLVTTRTETTMLQDFRITKQPQGKEGKLGQSIFELKTKGLLNIKDFNDGNYN